MTGIGCTIVFLALLAASLHGVHIPLTLHCARHCWASISKSKNIPLSVINDGLVTILKRPHAFVLHCLTQAWWIG